MDFGITEEQQAYKDKFAEFAREELNGDVKGRDENCELSMDLWKKCAEFGMQGLPFPKEYGGAEKDIIDTVLAMEGLGLGCRDNGLLFAINGQMWTLQMPIWRFGTEEQKQKYLRGMIEGDIVGAHGISEKEAGSDVMSLQTRAEKQGDSYVLNGSKVFCSNAPVADLFLIFATVNPKAGSLGITGFLVDRDTPGLNISPNKTKMGLRTAPMAELHIENCVVPESARLGKQGQGGRIFAFSSEWERSAILATMIGAMEYQLDKCIAYANERVQFKNKIAKFQSVSNRIVDMRLRLELSRLLLYKVAWKKKEHGECPLEATLAKMYLSESWVESCRDTTLIHGGYGYLSEYEIERDFRDAVGSLIYSGTSDIQRNIAARMLGL